MKSKLTKTLKQLAALARKSNTKRELSETLKGADLAEAWRILQIQIARHKTREEAMIGNCHYGSGSRNGGNSGFSSYLTPQPLDKWSRKGVKRSAWKTTQRWGMGDIYRYRYYERIADSIFAGWKYSWDIGKYVLSVRHSHDKIEVGHSRSQSRYDNFYTDLVFNLILQEAVWIGGLLTIRAKADRRKKNYPCHWLIRHSDGPGLLVRRGRILRGDFHEENPEDVEARRAIARVKYQAYREVNREALNIKAKERRERIKYQQELQAQRLLEAEMGHIERIPTKGWVNKKSSIAAGNCSHGTENFIRNELTAAFRKAGVTVGNLAGIAVRKSFVLSIRRDRFTRRL